MRPAANASSRLCSVVPSCDARTPRFMASMLLRLLLAKSSTVADRAEIAIAGTRDDRLRVGQHVTAEGAVQAREGEGLEGVRDAADGCRVEGDHVRVAVHERH